MGVIMGTAAYMSPEQARGSVDVRGDQGHLLREGARGRSDGRRIMRVPYDPALPVDTYWDLGTGDNTAIWFSQCHGRAKSRRAGQHEHR